MFGASAKMQIGTPVSYISLPSGSPGSASELAPC